MLDSAARSRRAAFLPSLAAVLVLAVFRRPFGYRTRTALLTLAVVAAFAALAGALEEAPRRPPEPFRVFVHAGDPADNSLKASLEETLPMVRERVERRRHWFQLADSFESADLTLRLVNYRTGQHWNPLFDAVYGGPQGREFHFLDAVVQGGGVRTKLSGLDERPVETGPSLRNAASHLVEELERFVKDNFRALWRFKAEGNERPPVLRGGGLERP